MDDVRYNDFLKVYLLVLDEAEVTLKNATKKINLLEGLTAYTKATRSSNSQYQTVSKFSKLKVLHLGKDLILKRMNPNDIIPAPVIAVVAQQKTRVFKLLSEMYVEATWKVKYFDKFHCGSMPKCVTAHVMEQLKDERYRVVLYDRVRTWIFEYQVIKLHRCLSTIVIPRLSSFRELTFYNMYEKYNLQVRPEDLSKVEEREVHPENQTDNEPSQRMTVTMR